MIRCCLILSLAFFCAAAFPDSLPASFLEDYYSSGRIEKEAAEAETEKSRTEFENSASAGNFAAFLDNLNVYALYALMEDDLRGGLKEYDRIVDRNIKNYFDNGKILNSYLDLKWQEMSLGGNFRVLNFFPFYCRRLSKNDGYRSNAMLKLALWYIYATDATMARWNVFIRNQEHIIEEMDNVEKYNAYLHYAVFYMKTGERSRAFGLLAKAEKIYPENLMHFILSENFKKGEYGW